MSLNDKMQFEKHIKQDSHDCGLLIKHIKQRPDEFSALWINHWEHHIKYNKLILLRLKDSVTKELDDKIETKMKQCLFDRMEIIEELVDAGIIDENLYLEFANELQRLFSWF